MCPWKVGCRVEGKKKDSDDLNFRISNAALGLPNLTATHSSRNHIPGGIVFLVTS